jgi:DNA-binding IclR family transcriptional regulator
MATSLQRSLLVLEALGSDEAVCSGLGVLRLAELVRQDKSQVSRTLKALAEQGLVDRDPATRAYRLGWGVFALAARAGDTRLLTAGEPVVQELARTVGERTHLSVLRGHEVLTVLSSASSRALETAGWVGRIVPAYCTSSGYALLVDADVEAVLRGVELVQLGPRTPRSLRAVAARVASARERGFAVADEEFEPGLLAVAAPVRDFRGRVVAALNASGPTSRLDHRVEEVGEAVRAAAGELSVRLGGRAYETLPA